MPFQRYQYDQALALVLPNGPIAQTSCPATTTFGQAVMWKDPVVVMVVVTEGAAGVLHAPPTSDESPSGLIAD
jgi:hypothetical protein